MSAIPCAYCGQIVDYDDQERVQDTVLWPEGAFVFFSYDKVAQDIRCIIVAHKECVKEARSEQIQEVACL